MRRVQVLCHFGLLLLLQQHPPFLLFFRFCCLLSFPFPFFQVSQVFQDIKRGEVLEGKHTSTGDGRLVADVGSYLLYYGLRCSRQHDIPEVE